MAVSTVPSPFRVQDNCALFPKNQFPCSYSFVRPTHRFSSILFRPRIYASSAVALEPEARTESQETSAVDLFACPVCYEPLIRKGPSGFNLPAIYRSGFKCSKCNKTYSSKNIYLDLTVTAEAKDYNEFKPPGTELFRSPVVSFLYERGWRQNFNRSGFPGPDDEFNMAQEYFEPVAGGVLVDVSCGSGLFSRKFAKSGVHSRVVALDFSENMLRQCYDFIKTDDSILSSNLALVRADVSRLPFACGSIDAVHAGAALHCWPSPSNAVAEINRILRSGGVFVGTTFLRVSSSTPAILRTLGQKLVFSGNGNGVTVVRYWKEKGVKGDYYITKAGTEIDEVAPTKECLGQLFTARNYNYLTQEEIEDLCTSCGLINYSCKIQQSFIMFSAQKP